MKKTFASSVFGIALAVVLCAGSIPAFAQKYQIGHVNPTTKDDQYNKLAQGFADTLKKISNGKYEIEVIGNSQLGGERDMMEGMPIGTVDFAIITNLYFGNFLPQAQLFDLPFVFSSSEQAAKVLDGDLGKKIADLLYEKCGVKLLCWGEGGFRHTLNNVRPLNKVSDYAGLKIRIPESAIYVDTYKALGANATPIAFAETFTAVQQGTADGLELPIFSIYTCNYYEICKYLSLDNHFFSPITICMSRKIWDGLSKEDQDMMMKAAQQAAVEERAFVKDFSNTLLDRMKAKGLKINAVSDTAPHKEACKRVYDAYRAKIGSDLIDALLAQTK